MDWLTFFSNIIDSMAWPIVTLILVFIVMRKAPQIAQVVKSIKYKDVEVVFRENFSKARELIGTIKIDNVELAQEKISTDDIADILQLASIDRSLAIFKIWQSLEAKVIQLIQHNGLIRFTNITKFIQKLLDLGKINKADAELFSRLQSIRNDVVHLSPYGHEVGITMAEVMEYKEFVDTFIARLESIRQEDGYIDIE